MLIPNALVTAQQIGPTRLNAGMPVTLQITSLFHEAPQAYISSDLTAHSTAVIGIVGDRASFMTMRISPRVILSAFPLPDGSNVDLEMSSFALFDESSEFLAVTPSGTVRRSPPDIRFYRGIVKGQQHSWAYLAIEQEGMSGSIISKGVSYNVTTEKRMDPTDQPVHVVHVFESSPEMSAYDCGILETDVTTALGRTKEYTLQSFAEERDTLIAMIAIDADQAAQKHYGSTAATEAYVLARMGESSAIYERDLVIKLKVPFLRVWETLDPFPGNSDRELLNVFTKYWKENMGDVERTLAALITRKPISANGVTQGVAWLDKLCSKDLGYSITKFSSNNAWIDGHVGVLAHELGHNFGSPHTHSCWWNPPVDSCYTAEPNPGKPACFKSSDQHLILGGGEMMSYCHMAYGGKNKHNIFRERVGNHVRKRAEEATCMQTAGYIGRPPMLSLTVPVGGEEFCAGSNLVITWTAQVNNDLSIVLSRNDGATYDTVLVGDLDRTERSWTWSIPNNFPSGSSYRIRVKDNRNDTLRSSMQSSFTIKPGTVVLTQILWRNVCAGQGANFNLTAAGPGSLSYQWKRNGVNIPGATTNNLQLEGMTLADDSSLYTCVVTSDCGDTESKPAVLRVFDKPRIVQHPNNDTVCVGGRATLRIIAEGPNLTYRWLTLGKVFEVNSPEFTVDNVTQTTSYYCEVTSSCGVVNTNTGTVVVPAASVSFLTPTPYQELTAGGTFELRWKQFCLGNLRLEYTTNNGASWTVIHPSLSAASGKFVWTVPPVAVNEGSFRLTDTQNTSITRISPSFRVLFKPTLTLSTKEISFGLVPVGGTSSMSMTFANSGSAALDVTKADITGTSLVTVRNGTPFSVSPGSQYELNLDFTPTDVGRMDGKLLLEHNAGGKKDTITLIGDAFIMTSTSTLPRPTTLALHQNFPNPVSLTGNGQTHVTFDLPRQQYVKLTVFNALGTEVRTVLSDYRSAGRHEVLVRMSGVPAGTYLFRLESGGKTLTRVMHVLK